jgi:hypothetical protein
MLMRGIVGILGPLLIILLIGCGNESEKTQSEAVEDEPSAQQAEIFDSLVIVLQGREGTSVFDLLLVEHEVDFIESAMGNFVNAIDSIEICNDFGWLYSVNGEMGTVASDKYITGDTDVVKWHYRKF